ncbi:MAG: helix-turn-helix domain-containing protein, partial [Prevotella sp.]|nr:helix-turn-helix domain-containing protein [Prevotella sp.]
IKENVNNVSRIKLSDSQRDAAIKVKCINHIYPSDCLIKWTFDNPKSDNAQWSLLNEDKFITFGDLNAGKYQLAILAVSKESGKTLDEHTVSILIKPPFYFSFLGLLIELLVLVLTFFLVRRYYKSANAIQVSNDKINFFVNTAHDIRTPLALIKAPLEELNQSTTLNAEEREAVSLALRNTNTLSQMTDSAMRYELESIEKGIMRIERHEAIAHFQTQVDKISRLAQTKRQTIVFKHPQEEFSVWVDVRKLNSIIQNLLSNAIKYSDDGGVITLELYCDERNWGFYVRDKGIGITEDEKTKLFKQVFRGANAINAKTFGCGIGLLSIYKYVRLMKGRIDVKSVLNQGSDFHIRFPRGKAHYDEQTTEFVESLDTHTADCVPTISALQQDCSVSADEHRHRLLIVEDNPEMLNYLKRLFDKDFAVYTATNGREALSKLPYIQPLIVLSDVMMPEMRGDDLCVSIKSNIDTSHIAVVLISALSDQQSIINGLTVKADAYVTKPFDTKVLQLTIGNLVENRLQLRHQLVSLESAGDLPDAASELDLKLMAEMKEIILRNLANDELTVDTLAYELRVSRTTLYNKVKLLTGNPPSDLIRIYRIDRAKALLREHRYTVTEVAELVGFADQKYFREVFKKAEGITPSEYAKGRN